LRAFETSIGTGKANPENAGDSQYRSENERYKHLHPEVPSPKNMRGRIAELPNYESPGENGKEAQGDSWLAHPT
jgi:hypothetical protein